jgi:hypothetical protein
VFRYSADLEGEVDLGALVHFQHHPGSGDPLETRVVHLCYICAGQKEAHGVIAVLIGVDLALGGPCRRSSS